MDFYGCTAAHVAREIRHMRRDDRAKIAPTLEAVGQGLDAKLKNVFPKMSPPRALCYVYVFNRTIADIMTAGGYDATTTKSGYTAKTYSKTAELSLELIFEHMQRLAHHGGEG